jgi:hypothetical protein
MANIEARRCFFVWEKSKELFGDTEFGIGAHASPRRGSGCRKTTGGMAAVPSQVCGEAAPIWNGAFSA